MFKFSSCLSGFWSTTTKVSKAWRYARRFAGMATGISFVLAFLLEEMGVEKEKYSHLFLLPLFTTLFKLLEYNLAQEPGVFIPPKLPKAFGLINYPLNFLGDVASELGEVLLANVYLDKSKVLFDSKYAPILYLLIIEGVLTHGVEHIDNFSHKQDLDKPNEKEEENDHVNGNVFIV